MPFEYLPVMAQNSAPKPPRVLAAPSKPAWYAVSKPVSESRVALLSSAALRLVDQEPFIPREDLSYRRVPSDPGAGDDHYRSSFGHRPSAEAGSGDRLSAHGVGKSGERKESSASSRPFHFSFMGGVRRHERN